MDDSDTDEPPDPGPVVRMVSHLKEAAMIAYRLGNNGVRATGTVVGTVEDAFTPHGIFGEDTIRATIKRAFVGMPVHDAAIERIAQFLLGEIERGIIAGYKK